MDPKWVLLVFCRWMYSVSATVNISIPVSVQEVTTPSVSFSSSVTTMIPHPSNPRVLVITNYYAVWTLDLQTFNKTLIAGSSGTTSGYIEGFGSAARFYSLRGSAEFDQTTILVVGRNNHCLRTVSLISGSTQRYAGVCQSHGSNDGYRTSAKFYYPWGMAKKGSTFYINDYSNNKIRKLDGNIVSTLLSLSNRPTGLSWNGEKFLYSFRHGVGDSQSSVITGSLSSGFSDGSLNSARFHYPEDVLAITTQVFLVADWSNRAVRLGDLSKQTVSTLNITNSRWSHPRSLMILNGSVYVGTNYGRIFKFPLNEIPVVVQELDCSADLTLSSGQCGESVIFEPNIADTESVDCLNCPETQSLGVGVYNFTYTYRGSLGYDLKTCNQDVTVQDVSYFECPHDQHLSLPADAGYVNVTLQKPQTSCDWSKLRCVECPSSAQLNKGEHEIKFTYRNLITGINLTCNYSIHVVKDASSANKDYFECPDDWNVTLPFNPDYVNITLSKPHTTVDWSNLRCVECPSSAQLYEGEHEINFAYRNLFTGRNLTCSYSIHVVKQTIPTYCENITEHIYLSADQKVSNTVSVGDTSITLPPGVSSFESIDFCHHIYIVHEWNNMIRQSEFQAQYPLSCSTLSKSRWFITASLLNHKTYLTTGCPECKVTSDSPDTECLNDTLIVTWKTHVTGSQRDRKSDMESNLRAALTEFQSRNQRLHITVFNAGALSIILPVIDESGMDLKVMIKTSCVDEGLVYDQQSDSCVSAPCAH